MTLYRSIIACICAATLSLGAQASASPGSALLKSLSRHLSRAGGEEAAERLSKEVGETVVERVAAKTIREGGDATLDRVSLLVADHGSDVIRALDNSPAVEPILKAFSDLPAEQVSKAAGRLAAGPAGRDLADTTIRHGAAALRAEVAHPGVGGQFVKALGTDGASLCQRLTTDQAVALGRHVDDIATLPPSQREGVLRLAAAQTDRFVQFIGRFVEQNPGKVLFTTAGTGLLLAESERILGGDELAFDKDGNPIVVSKPGLIGRGGEGATNAVVRPVVRTLLWIVAPFLAGLAGIKLWGVWRREQLRAASLRDRR